MVGIMSGTSADGIGVVSAIVEGSGLDARATTEAFRVFPYSPPVRERLLRLTTDAGSATEVCLLNFVLGELYARSALALLAEAGIDPGDVDLIGMDGHTIQRVVPPVTVDGVETGATLQIGEPAVVAERTGVTTVSYFRTRDVAVGGEGAPISSYVDFLLFRHLDRTRVVLNIGGISAMTIAPAGAGIERVFAVTGGPGNMVIDAVVRCLTNGAHEYDADGAWARRGTVHQGLLDELMRDPFFSRKPPKSAGRELFGAKYVDELMRRRAQLGIGDDDLVATATALTAEGIAN
ncbi:MAG: anhydro-N-acetylmuramic acid kinase, partial [Phycisphaerales bacterium]|nr:anhydro-N-acetylmuramic acid kinase [Phycisphaerales bacterium]